MRRRAIATVAAAIVASLPVAAPNLAAASPSRAVLVVDLGDGNERVHALTFSGEISGLDALERAGYDPLTRSFGGLGVAVCALTVAGEIRGCPADSTCLLCANPSYWSYARDPDQRGEYAPSKLGPSATVVGDGDVEAWRWGTGDPPDYVGFESQFPSPTTAPPASSTSTTTGRTAPAVTGVGATTSTANVTASTNDPREPTSTAVTTVDAPTASTTGEPPRPTSMGPNTSVPASRGATPDDRSAARIAPVVRQGNSSRAGFVVFAITVVAFIAVIVGIRRSRRFASRS
jgi:hypothetical protein